MSFAFLKRALGFKKNRDERQYEEFIKNFNPEVHFNISQMSKSFRKNAFRLIVLRNSSDSIIYDSLLNKEQRQMPTFINGGEKVTLIEAAFGACPLSKDKELKSSMKLHDLKASKQILITCVYNPSIRRVRCTNSASYSRNPYDSIKSTTNMGPLNTQHSISDQAIAVCLLISLEWIQPLLKFSNNSQELAFKSDVTPSTICRPVLSPSSQSSTSKILSDNASELLTGKFYCMVFEHFLQISVLFESLSQNIVHKLHNVEQSRPANASSFRSRDIGSSKFAFETYSATLEFINQSFTDFQQAFRDLCIPKLARPVWPTLSLMSSSEPFDFSSEALIGNVPLIQSWINQVSNFNYATENVSTITQQDRMINSFVRGCLCAQISKAFVKDKGYFLGQLLTGILMYHNGWTSTVLPRNQESPNNPRNTCDSFETEKPNYLHSTVSENSISTNNLLEQLLAQFGCTLVRHNCEGASTLSYSGNVFSTTVLFGQQRNRLLALLYLCTYFLRSPLLLHSREHLPDFGRADLCELDKQQRRVRNGSKSRRKSGSLVSSSGATGSGGNVNRGYSSSDRQDSGISSQEDLTATPFSASAGSSPSHPAGMTLCHTHRLTLDQCRFAEKAAHNFVNHEAAQKNNMNRFSASQKPAPSFKTPNMLKGHTWTASGVGCLPSLAGVLASDLSTPCRGSQLTEIPLLIEKSFDGSQDVCWCLDTQNCLIDPEQHLYSSFNSSCLDADEASVKRSPNKFHITTVSAAAASIPPAFPSLSTKSMQTTPSDKRNSSYSKVSNSPHADYNIMNSSFDFGFPNRLDSTHSLAMEVNGIEVGTPCLADVDELQIPDSDVTYHCQVGLGVSDRYTSGLALQATSESLDSFRTRLQSDLYAWLQYAPNMVRRVFYPPTPSERLGLSIQERRASSFASSPTQTNLCCSSLLVNVDASTVEVMTVKRHSEQISDNATGLSVSFFGSDYPLQQRSFRSSCFVADPVNKNIPMEGLLSFGNNHRNTSSFGRMSVAIDEKFPTSVDPGTALGKDCQKIRHIVQPAPTLIRLLETVKLLVDKGVCPNLALQHLEAGLQMLYSRASALAALIALEGIELLQRPERMTIVGCLRGDLPLLLSIARVVSCKVAALFYENDVDIHDVQ